MCCKYNDCGDERFRLNKINFLKFFLNKLSQVYLSLKIGF